MISSGFTLFLIGGLGEPNT